MGSKIGVGLKFGVGQNFYVGQNEHAQTWIIFWGFTDLNKTQQLYLMLQLKNLSFACTNPELKLTLN